MTNQQIIVQQDCMGISSTMTSVPNCTDYMRDVLSKCKKAYVVHGHHSYFDCGAAAFMEELQQQTHCDYHNFYAFSNNPKIEEVQIGVKDIQTYRPDIIIAIGGGSVIDMAKLIRYYAQLPVELIAIPTTAGTGAESTHFAVCYVEGVKESIVTILPNQVVLMPEFTTNNSQYLTACTGFDAFAQAIEAFWNIYATEESDLYAEEAIARLYGCLKQFAENPQPCMADSNWREEMIMGANLAGQAINITKTTAPHAMSYKLTSKYGYAHGHAVALTFPYFANLNIECMPELYNGAEYPHYSEKMRWLRRTLDIREQDIEAYFRTFIKKLGLGYRQDSKVDPDIIAQSINIERAGNNPHLLTADIIHAAAKSILNN
jgi:alcohol dehydrogenase class IV